jgi:hypothetical protein
MLAAAVAESAAVAERCCALDVAPQVLQAPQDESAEIAKTRFPVPRVVDCDYGGSQVGRLLVLVRESVR